MTRCTCGKMKIGDCYTGADFEGHMICSLSRNRNVAYSTDGMPAHYCRDTDGKKLASWAEEFE